MELKNTMNLQCSKNERTYILSIPVNAPYGEIYDALLEMSQAIVNLANQAVVKLQQEKEQQTKEGA